MSSERLSALPVLLAASLAVLLALLLAAALPAAAQSLPDAPDAPGSIAGTVTAEGGAPLAGIEVQIYRLQWYGGWWPERTLTTDANGSYLAAVLQANTYRVGFRDPAGVYGSAYYADAQALANATDIAVAGVDVTGIDAVLRPAGAVTGIYSDTTTPYIYTEIAALVPGDGAWQKAASVSVTTTGPYTLTGLAPGVYRVCAYAQWYVEPLPYPTVCYDDIISSRGLRTAGDGDGRRDDHRHRSDRGRGRGRRGHRWRRACAGRRAAGGSGRLDQSNVWAGYDADHRRSGTL